MEYYVDFNKITDKTVKATNAKVVEKLSDRISSGIVDDIMKRWDAEKNVYFEHYSSDRLVQFMKSYMRDI